MWKYGIQQTSFMVHFWYENGVEEHSRRAQHGGTVRGHSRKAQHSAQQEGTAREHSTGAQCGGTAGGHSTAHSRRAQHGGTAAAAGGAVRRAGKYDPFTARIRKKL